jgi:hypothetical protein
VGAAGGAEHEIWLAGRARLHWSSLKANDKLNWDQSKLGVISVVAHVVVSIQVK